MILVTGASGFVGRSLMAALAQANRPARAYGKRINNPLSLRSDLSEVTTVIHLVSAESRGRIRPLQHVDVEGTERLLEECRRAGVGHLIFVSRLNADMNSLYPLLRAKGEVERLIQNSGIPYTILRSATLFGRHDRFTNMIVALAAWSWPVVVLPGGGRVAMQPLWVEDLVRCLLVVLDQPDRYVNNVIEVAGEERTRYATLVGHLLRAAGLSRLPVTPAVKLLRPAAVLLFGWWLRPPISRFFMDRFTVPEVAPYDNVFRYFGFRPSPMDRHIAYLRKPGLRRRLFRNP
jgi:uncharacterized protein YbjT (DUF2867 family)